MIVLLDENFTLGLLHSLQSDGLSAEDIITVGWRCASDARIRERLQDDRLLFLTQDEDFLFGERAGRRHQYHRRQADLIDTRPVTNEQ